MTDDRVAIWEVCRHCGRRFNWLPIHYHWCSWDCYDGAGKGMSPTP